jgi:hypothetical protein
MTRDRIASIIYAWVRAGDVAQKPALDGLARELEREVAAGAVDAAAMALYAYEIGSRTHLLKWSLETEESRELFRECARAHLATVAASQ